MCVVGSVEGEKFHFSSVKERGAVAAIKAWTVQWGSVGTESGMDFDDTMMSK